MKKSKILAAAMAAALVAQAPEMAAQAKTEVTITKASKKKIGLKAEKGGYYYYKNGKKVKSCWITVKKKTYYMTKNGSAAIGWTKISGKAYYFDEKGVMVKNKKVDGIKLNKKGAASLKNERVKLKLKAQEVLNKKTKKAWGSERKLSACYQYVVKCTYLPRNFSLTKSGWERTYALDMLNTRKGNCYSYAAAFGILARECGYDAKIVIGNISKNKAASIPHAWVEIDGKVYDPQSQVNMKLDLYGKSYEDIQEITYEPRKRV